MHMTMTVKEVPALGILQKVVSVKVLVTSKVVTLKLQVH